MEFLKYKERYFWRRSQISRRSCSKYDRYVNTNDIYISREKTRHIENQDIVSLTLENEKSQSCGEMLFIVENLQ